MEDLRTRRIVALIIIAAFLLHVVFLIFFLAWQHHSKDQELKFQEFLQAVQEERQKQMTPEQQQEWAEMRQGGGEFGTTVLFQDEPEFSAASRKVQEISEKKDEKSQAIEKEDPKSLEKVAQIEKESTQLAQEEQQKKEKNELQLADDGLADSPTEPTIRVMAGDGKKDAAPKPPISLSSVAKGFISKIDMGGKDSMSMYGKKGSHPSIDQLAYKRYMEKFSRCVHNSHNIHRNKMPSPKNAVDVGIAVSLLRDGTLADLFISRSTGIKEIDDYVLFVYRDAAPGFPPVPTSVKDEQLNFECYHRVCCIEAEKPSFRFTIR